MTISRTIIQPKKPYRVNSWHKAEDHKTVEVWFNGKDGYNIYENEILIDTLYFHSMETECSAVTNACHIGYFRCYGKKFE